MTYNPVVPNAAQSPGLFPTQNNNNYTRLKQIINNDHVFNDTQNVNTDGIHRQVTMLARTAPVSLPTGTNAILYTAVDSLSRAQLYYYNGVITSQITPTVAIRAAVAFDNSGTIQSQFNVASIVKTGTSIYTITFTSAMPNANYIVQVTGMRPGANTICNGSVLGNSFASSVTTTFVKVVFTGGDSSQAAIERGYVTIFSVT